MGKQISESVSSALLQKVAEGDESAFRKVHDLYEGFIRSAIKKYIPDEEDCNEISQQVFLTLWERRRHLSEVRSFHDYLFITTRNKVFKYFSRLRKEALIIKELQQQSVYHQNSTSSAELREYQLLWEHAVHILPLQQRNVYTMIEQQEESIDSVAKQLQLARGTVKKHLELARKAVRKFIASQLDGGENAKIMVPLVLFSLFIF